MHGVLPPSLHEQLFHKLSIDVFDGKKLFQIEPYEGGRQRRLVLNEGSNRRIHVVDRHAGMAIGCLASNGRQIVFKARSEASNYQSFYDEEIPVGELSNSVVHYAHLNPLYFHDNDKEISHDAVNK